MHATLKFVLAAAVLGAGIFGGYLVMRSKAETLPQQPRASAQIVKTERAEQKSIPIIIRANGYVTAINTVDVRPQVQNVVRAVHVQEGQEVKAGQLLFTLDERGDLSNLEKARAQLAHDRADLADAELTLKRNQELLAKSFISQAVVDTSRNKVESARGTLHADQAAIEAAQVALGYNKITASMSGRIGAIAVHPGSLAQPAGTPMLTISQLDPVAVGFSVPERELSYLASTYPKGDAPVSAQLPGKKELGGRLIFIDNTADAQSGTIRMKAQFSNPDRTLWPGAFVNVQLISRTLPDAVVVSAQAVITGPNDKLVYVVQPDDTVKIRKVEIAAIEGGLAAVTGLGVGERVVVEGAQNLRPGSKVKEAQAIPVDALQQKKT